MKRIISGLAISLAMGLVLATSAAAFASPPVALVWRGPGACQPGCGSSANEVARQAGFRTIAVRPGFQDEEAFRTATLWVQPGGKSVESAEAMGASLLQRVRQFVADGGGYVGFCAGMFLTSDQIGESGITGLGIIPGKTSLFMSEDDKPYFFPVHVAAGDFKMYYSGGPALEVSDAQLKAVGGEVIARYDNGAIAGIHSHFGKGQVAVIGAHPEASWIWKAAKGFWDRSSERWFAIQMIRSVTAARPSTKHEGE